VTSSTTCRVGDSPSNVSTPVRIYPPFLALGVRHTATSAGVGAVVSTRASDTVALVVPWTLVFVVWYALDIPRGRVPRSTRLTSGAPMNASMLAHLNDAERLLVAETEPATLALLDEDAVDALHTRIRRARNKYTGRYRREAAARVSATGGRGTARPANRRNAVKAEVFEDALARVSRRLATLAKQSAADLRDERLTAARDAKAGTAPKTRPSAPTSPSRPKAARAPSTRSPRTEKARAGTTAAGARHQAKRDSR